MKKGKERENWPWSGSERGMQREKQNNDYLSTLAKHIDLYALLKVKFVVTEQILYNQ